MFLVTKVVFIVTKLFLFATKYYVDLDLTSKFATVKDITIIMEINIFLPEKEKL